VTRAHLVPIVRAQPAPGSAPSRLDRLAHGDDRRGDRAAARFDVIHFHIDHLHFPLARRCKTPCVTTLHGGQDLPDLAAFYTHFSELPVVSISDSQREPPADG
jgi:hypothetical protein